MDERKLKIWYAEGDYLEVTFDQKAGYFRETASGHVKALILSALGGGSRRAVVVAASHGSVSCGRTTCGGSAARPSPVQATWSPPRRSSKVRGRALSLRQRC